MHAFGGVALLAGQHAVGLEPSVDQRRVRVDLGAAAPVRGGFDVMSSMSAYFATVARSTFSLLAISDLDTP